MSLLDAIRYRLRVFKSTHAHEKELADELEFHLELDAMQREHVAHGALSAKDARAQAKREFGNATYYREETRRTAGLTSLDTFTQDVRFAVRSFRRSPTFTTVAVLTLAVGIGANTAIFSAVNALLLRPLPFREPARLTDVSLTLPPRAGTPENSDVSWSYQKFRVLRDAQKVFDELTLWSSSEFTVRGHGAATREKGEFTDSHLFTELGIPLALGRGFVGAEDSLGAPHVAVISHAMWSSQYGAEESVLGKSIDVDGTAFTIVGVAPERFRGFTGETRFWIPIVAAPAVWDSTLVSDPFNHRFNLVARLKPGVSLETANAQVAQIGVRVNATYPDRRDPNFKLGARAQLLDDIRVGDRIRTTLFILSAAVGLVLLIACANVANLFLVRSAGRSREIAVRLALGAGRWRIVRQLMIESLLLGLVGGVASVFVAWCGVHALSSLQIATVLHFDTLAGVGLIDGNGIELDMRALAFTGTLAIGTAVVFGLVPAMQSTRPSLTNALQRTGADASSRVRRMSSRNLLVMVEIALAVVLLAGSGLMMRSLGQLLGVQPGFEPAHLLTMRTNRAPVWSRDSISRFYDVSIERLRAVPGVVDVAMIDCPPLQGCEGNRIQLPDRPPPPPGAEYGAGVHWVTPGWFAVAGVPILNGTTFSSADRIGSRRAVVISESAAQRFWPGENPIGRALSVAGRSDAYVIGVVGDVRFNSVDGPPRPEVYVSYYQEPFSARMMMFVKTKGDPLAAVKQIRSALNEVAPGFPVYDVASMEERLSDELSSARFSALLLSLFAAVALLLAMIGTYGVISFIVSQRTREIGLRIALGASQRDVVQLIVGQGVSMAVIGAVFGLGTAYMLTRFIRTQLYDVQPADPATLAGIVIVLGASVLAASWIPARRAAAVSAMQSLRTN